MRSIYATCDNMSRAQLLNKILFLRKNIFVFWVIGEDPSKPFSISFSSSLSSTLSLSLSLPSSVAPFFLPTFRSLVSMCPLQSSLPNTQHQAHFTCINTTDVYRIHISLSPNFVWVCHKPSKYAVWQRHSGNHCHVSSCIIFFALLDLNRTRY